MSAIKAAIQRTNIGYQFGLIGFTRLGNILRLSHYALSMHPRYIPRLFLVLATSVCSLPLRLWEVLVYGRRIARVRIDPPPIFIIGHWRSGTTHLHNLMSQDPSLGYLSMYQAMVPDCSLVGQSWLKPLLAYLTPVKRPMDNMVWPMDGPQEEEIPLAKVLPFGFYTQFLFPRKSRHLFQKYVLIDHAPAWFIKQFKRQFYRLLQIATLHVDGRRLVLKNPVNTARVQQLLDLFPDAKFVHIHRSPYEVFVSTKNLRNKMFAVTTVQQMRTDDATDTILAMYADMMRQYLAERSLIPKDNLVEVRFEDLEKNPLAELQRVYDGLKLPGYVEAQPAFQRYVASQKSYRKNSYNLSAQEREQVEQYCAFAFEEWNYVKQEQD